MSGLKAHIRRRVRTINPQNRMHMMRITKNVEEDMREVGDGGVRMGSKKGVHDRLGRNDWVRSLLISKNMSNPRDPECSFNLVWSNLTQKVVSNGFKVASTTLLAYTERKSDNETRFESTMKW